MTRHVFCKKYQQELPGLAAPPLPGQRGQDIFETVSQKAWQDWLAHQTRLINEKHLNLMDKDSRRYLSEQMESFFSGGSVDQAEGYVPENATPEPSKSDTQTKNNT